MKLKKVVKPDPLYEGVEKGFIKPSDVVVYNVLSLICGEDERVLPVSYLTGKCHMSHVTVRKCLKNLSRYGFIVMEQADCTNAYAFSVPSNQPLPDWALAID